MKQKGALYVFVLTLSLMALLRIAVMEEYSLLSPAKFTLMILFVLAINIIASTKLINDFDLENNYQKRILTLFFAYELFILVRGFPTNYTGIKTIFQSEYLIWVYFIPLFIFFDKRLIKIKYLMDIIYYSAIFFLIVSVLQPHLVTKRATAETFIHPFAFSCGFLLLNARFLPKNRKTVALIALLVGIASFTYLARRNGIVSYVGVILASTVIGAKNLSATKTFRVLILLAAIITSGFLFIDYLPASFTQKLNERLTEDSRSYVFDYFFKEMNEHILVGKGVNGKYYCPTGVYVNEEGFQEGEADDNRDIIENGYLQLYLKGGLIYVVLFCLVLLPAAFLGVFKSQNQFTKACGIIIFLWMIDMAIFGLPRILLQYVLVWICAGFCYMGSMREKTNEEIEELLITE